jgi:hypothetical protein
LQVHPTGPVGKPRRHVPGDLHRQPRLAAATRTGQRHHPGVRDQVDHLRTFTLAADKRRDPNRQPALHLPGLYPAPIDEPTADSRAALDLVGRWHFNGRSVLKTRVAHGYCSRDLVAEACPYANICEQCDNFVTTTQFLPALQHQLADVRALRDDAETRGWHSEATRHAQVITSIQDHLRRLNQEGDPGAPA